MSVRQPLRSWGWYAEGVPMQHASHITARQERLGQRSRKLAGRRNVGSLLKPCGLAGSAHPGRWGVRSAAEKGAPLEGQRHHCCHGCCHGCWRQCRFGVRFKGMRMFVMWLSDAWYFSCSERDHGLPRRVDCSCRPWLVVCRLCCVFISRCVEGSDEPLLAGACSDD